MNELVIGTWANVSEGCPGAGHFRGAAGMTTDEQRTTLAVLSAVEVAS